MRARSSAALIALALASGAMAGCGGSSETVTKTITTDRLPATAPATSVPTTTPVAPLGSESLPSLGAVSAVRPATNRVLPTAQAFVDDLYQSGDPVKPTAVARLQAAGYRDGVLRDQLGEEPASGITLFRTYALRLRDEAAATREVADSMAEVRRSVIESAADIDLPGIPGGQGLRIEISQGAAVGTVVFVGFAAGPTVYGLQGVSRTGATMPQDEIVGAARDLYERVTAAP